MLAENNYKTWLNGILLQIGPHYAEKHAMLKMVFVYYIDCPASQ